jgi:hypothetical protein
MKKGLDGRIGERLKVEGERKENRREKKGLTVKGEKIESFEDLEGYLKEAEDLGAQLIAFGKEVRQEGARF